jgi:hypothetical protein
MVGDEHERVRLEIGLVVKPVFEYRQRHWGMSYTWLPLHFGVDLLHFRPRPLM